VDEVALAGQFLVATPMITSPPFARAVVLLLDHDDSGAIGLVLNNPTDLVAKEHISGVGECLSLPGNVFLGGPVSTDTAISLGRGTNVEFLRSSALPAIGIIDIEQVPDGLEDLRIFAGYSGWDPQQLESEIDEGAWWVLYPDLDEIFSAGVEGMWERTVVRGPGRLPLYTTYPADPSDN
jgi:putative transcriptional regulator